jgi:hypothetical protein
VHLEGADLQYAHLEEADLCGVHLEGADLRGVHLEEAEADERTSWPAGFDWRAAGVIMVDEDAEESPTTTDITWPRKEDRP